jgi:hypothetical protein
LKAGEEIALPPAEKLKKPNWKMGIKPGGDGSNQHKKSNSRHVAQIAANQKLNDWCLKAACERAGWSLSAASDFNAFRLYRWQNFNRDKFFGVVATHKALFD